jgi:REP element-mobilizing transposase RayT
MARPLRLEYEGALYHVTARGNALQPIYRDEGDRKRFLHLLGEEIDQQRWHCYAYCLMNNHYHLLLETPEGQLSAGMRHLNGTYTQWFNRRHKRVGHVLQGRFKSILVDKDNYLLELCRYIVLNPVRARSVRRPQDWPWSSYCATAGRVAAPNWLDVSGVLRIFHRTRVVAQHTYKQFVREGIPQDSPWEQVRGQIFLGDEAFLSQMARLVKGKRLTNVPREQTEPTRPSGEEVLERVASVYGLNRKRLLARTHAEAYQTAAWLLRRVANEPLAAVAKRFGVSPSRISHIQRDLNTQPFSRLQAKAQNLCKV